MGCLVRLEKMFGRALWGGCDGQVQGWGGEAVGRVGRFVISRGDGEGSDAVPESGGGGFQGAGGAVDRGEDAAEVGEGDLFGAGEGDGDFELGGGGELGGG